MRQTWRLGAEDEEVNEMSLNYSTLPLILDDAVKLVGVKFFADGRDGYIGGTIGGKMYCYMTKDTFEIGDVAVVVVSGTPKCVQVVELDVPLDDSVKCYKWLVGKVDMSRYEENVEIGKKLITEVKKLEHKSQKKQILEALGLDVVNSDEIKQIEFK